ncbi:hypothetical protein N7540_010881 [Penicillium herquei]|nr:hypothetical protein N7540_010881 [Penicillium herquei]
MEGLAPYDASEHLTMIQRMKAPVPGTCEWLVKLEEYINWRDGDSQISWLIGGPAMGKTVLSAYVIQNLIEMNKEARAEGFIRYDSDDNSRDQEPWLVAYYFCDSSSSKQTSLNGILGGLLRQLLRDGKKVFAKSRGIGIETVFEKNSLDTLWNFFRDILDKISRKVYVIVDGLDECDSAKQFLDLLSSDIQMQRIGAHVKFMISSRREQRFERYVEDLAVSLNLSPSNVESDVHKVIRQKLGKSTLSMTVGSEKAKEIEDALIKNSGGTFLWAHLVVDNLIPNIRNDQELKDIVEMLGKLPPELNAIYDRILRKICIHDRQRAAFILPFVAIALTPLKVADVDMAFAMVNELTMAEKIPTIRITNVWKSCMPFVFCDPETSIVHLVHVSAKEYLLSRRPKAVLKKVEFLFSVVLGLLAFISQYVHRLSTVIFTRVFRVRSTPSQTSVSMGPVDKFVTYINESPSMTPQQRSYSPQTRFDDFKFPVSADEANFLALHVSLSYLNREDFDHGKKIIRREKGQRLVPVFDKLPEDDTNCFAKYAAKNWARHAMALDPVSVVQYLRRFGHLATLETLRDNLLLSAAVNGNEVVLRFLVNEMGARINVANPNGNTALHLAALGGDLKIVRFLIDHGANQYTKDRLGANAIHWAVRGGHMETFRYLVAQRLHIEYNTWLTYWNATYPAGKIHELIGFLSPSTLTAVQYEMPDDKGGTLLVWAIESESQELVDFLLAQKVRINYLYRPDLLRIFTPKHTGDEILERFEDVLEQVEAWGSGKFGTRSPLSRAASKGHDSIIKALLDGGADRHFKDQSGCTPLFWASKRGHKSAVDLLITGRWNRQDQLRIAIWSGDLRATKNLIKLGISDPNQHILEPDEQDEFNLTPTAMATILNKEEILGILMEHNETTINEAPRQFAGFTPLRCAVLFRNDKALSLLLSSDRVDVDPLSDAKATPLIAAIISEQERAVQLLLDSKKVNTRLKTSSGYTSLSMAAASGNKAIFDMISAHGKFFTLADSTQRTTLFFAIRGGNHEIVESVLSDPTVLVMEKDIYGAIPLSIAARLGDTKSSVMLLRRNAPAQLIHKDKFGRTALAWAAYCSHAGTRDFLSRKCKEFGLSSEDENICPIIRQIKRGNEMASWSTLVASVQVCMGYFSFVMIVEIG